MSVGETKFRRKSRTTSTYGVIYEDSKENITSERD